MYKHCTQNDLINYYIASFERLLHIVLPACSKKAGKHISCSLAIIDCNGMSLTQAMSSSTREFINLGADIAKDYYPETTYKMFLINTPWLFSGLWKIVSIFLSKEMTSRISTSGGNNKKEISKYVNWSNLPKFLGGSNSTPLGEPYGPWAA